MLGRVFESNETGTEPLIALAQRNCDALGRFRPDLLEVLQREGRAASPYRLRHGPTGELTVVRGLGEGRFSPIIPGAAPEAYLRRLAPQLKVDFFGTIGVAGIGDGSLLALVARLQPKVGMWRGGQPVLVIEPDVDLLLAALHLHDFTGAQGPFADPRFRWCLGAQWEQQLHRHLVEHAELQSAANFVLGGANRPELAVGLQRVFAVLGSVCGALHAELSAHYACMTAQDFAELFSSQPPRKPRVLLMTSRFTTVLRHTARHLALAFENLGFDARILMEAEDHHRLSGLRMQRAVVEYKPDLVIVPDHLNSEFAGVFPPTLPYVCWIQDELPALCQAAAGRSVVQREFVWVRDPDAFRDLYQYPQQKLIPITSLTVERPLREDDGARGADLIYFSHGSWPSAQIVASAMGWVPVHGLCSETMHRLVTRLSDAYVHGEGVVDLYAFCAQVVPALATGVEARREWSDGRVLRHEVESGPLFLYVRALSHARSVLHRQQGLRWAAKIAKERGLSLAIHGEGWERLPEFAEFARGPADYATQVIPLSQAARINLVLEPWPVVSHWRGLDALAAGATLLARRDSFREPAFRRLGELLCSLEPRPATSEELLCEADASSRPALLELLERIQTIPFGIDPVPYVQAELDRGVDTAQLMSLPGLMDFSFDGPASLAERIDWLLGNPEAARTRTLALREVVVARYSYRAAAARLRDELARRLEALEAGGVLGAAVRAVADPDGKFVRLRCPEGAGITP